MAPVALYLIFALFGFFAQSVLSGGMRMGFDLIVGFTTGILATGFSIFYGAAVCVGIFTRMLITGYIHCSALMVLYIIVGLFLGVFLF